MRLLSYKEFSQMKTWLLSRPGSYLTKEFSQMKTRLLSYKEFSQMKTWLLSYNGVLADEDLALILILQRSSYR